MVQRMAPRRYDRRRRDEAMAATRERIVAAIVALHAELGPSRATYAMIAKRADVAIPTVYKHFPTLAGMFAACIGHVSAELPPLTAEIFARTTDAPGRVALLATALFERHRHFAPWLRWSRHEAHLLPELGVYLAKMRERQRKLIREALVPAHGAQAPHALVAVIDALVGFDSWQTLTADNGLAPDDAIATVVDALMAILAAPRARAQRPRAGGRTASAARPQRH
jgi:AcrR family transcriptional regulator